MKACVHEQYGSPDVLELKDVPKPVPAERDVLIKVYTTTVSRTDCGMLRPHPAFVRLFAGIRRPNQTILGMDFAGIVEAVGGGVTAFKPGDRVFGLIPDIYGTHAEYVCVPETGAIAVMPAGMRFRDAVVCEGAWYADTYLQGFRIEPGRTILVYGASGAIGTAAVQLAKAYGARVTAVAGTRHLDLVRQLGAERAVDYTTGDFTRIEGKFDFILDAVGKTTYFRCRNLLKAGGTFSATDLGPWGQNVFLSLWSLIIRNRRVTFPLPLSSTAGPFVGSLKKLMEQGSFRAVIDREYTFEKIADAYRYVETKQKTGIVVVTIRPEA